MKSLKTRIIFLISLLVLILSILLLAANIFTNITAFNKSMNVTYTGATQQAAERLNEYFYLSTTDLITLSSQSEMDESNSTSFFTTNMNMLQYENYALVDINGEIITSKGNLSGHITSLSAFSEAVSGNVQTFTVTNETTDGTTEFLTFIPVHSTGATEKVIVAEISFEDLNSYANAIRFGDNGYIYLVSDSGAILTDQSFQAATLNINPIQLKEVDSSFDKIANFHDFILENAGGTTQFTYGDVLYMGSSYEVEAIGGYAAMVVPYDELSDISSFILIFLGFLALLLIFSLVFVFVLLKRVVDPIVTTSKRLDLLSKGDLSSPIVVYSFEGEVGDMTKNLEATVNSLKTYITQISIKLNDIATGDLTSGISGDFPGDFQEIKNAFDDILGSLAQTFTSINEAAKQVDTSSTQVASVATALSDGATEQAGSIDTLSKSIENIAEQINDNSNVAQNVLEIVQNNADEMSVCNNDMGRMLYAMDEISNSSNQIAQIIKVIDDIAFQTNILALNAAVEAARAGAAGKGFAVVADEVRTLATKSAEAAKQTADIIKASLESVNNGTKIAKQTAESLASIVESSNEINTLIEKISNASKEQTEGIIHINENVTLISNVVQSNTATAEESAAESAILTNQSGTLRALIDNFKLVETFDFKEGDDLSGMEDFFNFDELKAAEPTPSTKFDTTDEDFMDFPDLMDLRTDNSPKEPVKPTTTFTQSNDFSLDDDFNFDIDLGDIDLTNDTSANSTDSTTDMNVDINLMDDMIENIDDEDTKY